MTDQDQQDRPSEQEVRAKTPAPTTKPVAATAPMPANVLDGESLPHESQLNEQKLDLTGVIGLITAAIKPANATIRFEQNQKNDLAEINIVTDFKAEQVNVPVLVAKVQVSTAEVVDPDFGRCFVHFPFDINQTPGIVTEARSFNDPKFTADLKLVANAVSSALEIFDQMSETNYDFENGITFSHSESQDGQLKSASSVVRAQERTGKSPIALIKNFLNKASISLEVAKLEFGEKGVTIKGLKEDNGVSQIKFNPSDRRMYREVFNLALEQAIAIKNLSEL